MTDPKLCSMLDCGKPLGPDALEFTHKGKDAGGICADCLEHAETIRVLLKLGEGKIYEATEMVVLSKR